jgi:hypothetical protein
MHDRISDFLEISLFNPFCLTAAKTEGGVSLAIKNSMIQDHAV